MKVHAPLLFAIAAFAAGPVSAAAPIDPAPALHVRDFNGDRASDLIARCASGPPLCPYNRHEVWFLNGPEVLAREPILPPLSRMERVVGAADFNRDGWADLLVASERPHGLVFWPMMGTVRIREPIPVTPPSGSGWEVAATADFDGRNGPDILWRDEIAGRLHITLLDGFKPVGERTPWPAEAPGPEWSIVAAEDFGSGPSPDILWLDPDRGAMVWLMDEQTSRVAEYVLQPSRPDPLGPWAIAAAGDYVARASNNVHRAGVVWWEDFLSLGELSAMMGGSGTIIIYEVDPDDGGGNTLVRPTTESFSEVPPGWRLVGPR